MAMVLDYLLDNPVVIVLLMVGSGMLLWRARRGSIRVPAAALLIGSTALLIWKVAHANILHHLAGNVVLVLFVLVGTGMLLGHVKIKGVSLGAAAVLFCGIALAAWGELLPRHPNRRRAAGPPPGHSGCGDPGRRGRGTSPRTQGSDDRRGLRRCRHEHTRPGRSR